MYKSSNGDKTLTILAYILLVFGLVYFSWHIGKAMGRQEITNQQSCQEDMACWDCETMGNKICGKDS